MNWGTRGTDISAGTIASAAEAVKTCREAKQQQESTNNANRITLFSDEGRTLGRPLTDAEVEELLEAQKEARKTAEAREQEEAGKSDIEETEEYRYDEINDEQGTIGKNPQEYDFDGTIGKDKIELAREKEYTLREYTDKEIKAERQMTLDEKIAFMRAEYESVQGEGYTDEERAFKIEQMRKLSTGLWGAFKGDDPEAYEFMNETLRDFLGRKPDGSENLTVRQLDELDVEYSSLFSQMHQSSVPEGDKLNAKFVLPDGREYIIDSNRNEVTDPRDKATYNYSRDILGHLYNDMKPYEKEMKQKGYTVQYKFNWQFWRGNSESWDK